jgi:plasmid stabilization system protein ParE
VPGNLHKGSVFLGDYAEIVRTLSAANPDAAERFCEEVERALNLLAAHPQLGTKAGFRHAPQVRKWVIQKFPNYLLFYQDRADGVLFIRLLHGARDLPILVPPQ